MMTPLRDQGFIRNSSQDGNSNCVFMPISEVLLFIVIIIVMRNIVTILRKKLQL